MNRFWTADMHLGHGNVIDFCKRPFRDADHMNTWMVDQANMRVKPEDRCIHVGDFCMKGVMKCRDWISQLHGDWIFIQGNHDKNNGVKPLCEHMTVKLSHFKVFVSHIPYYYCDPEDRCAKYHLGPALIDWIEGNCDFAICGHVHEKWKVSDWGRIPCINVGCDQWEYRPVADREVLDCFMKWKKEKE